MFYEPSTGLHIEDIRKLQAGLQRLVDAGNTVCVIEHNLDIIKTADWILDLGPEGGDGGGRLVAAGTPEQVAVHEESYTGRYLRETLERHGGTSTGRVATQQRKQAAKGGVSKAKTRRRGATAKTKAKPKAKPKAKTKPKPKAKPKARRRRAGTSGRSA